MYVVTPLRHSVSLLYVTFPMRLQDHFNGTLFRFPLRTATAATASDIKPSPCGPESVMGLLEALQRVMPQALLFLKSVRVSVIAPAVHFRQMVVHYMQKCSFLLVGCSTVLSVCVGLRWQCCEMQWLMHLHELGMQHHTGCQGSVWFWSCW